MATPKIEVTPENKKLIINVLNKFGVPASLAGYEYLKTGIEILLQEPCLIHRITKGLYPKIAEEYNTKGTCIERSIRHAVEVVFDRNSPEYLEDYFGGCLSLDNGKLTNSEFMDIVAEKVRMEAGAYDK